MITSSTVITAAHRGNPCRTSQDTAGSIPTARNNATPIRISTEPACMTTRISPTVIAAPPVAVIPIMNGDRQLNRGPRVPRGASWVLILAATASASATTPSAVECGCPTWSLCPVSGAGAGPADSSADMTVLHKV